MAGAAAKKSAAARVATAKIYQPILGALNAMYFILFALIGSRISIFTVAVHLLLLGLQFYAYIGILDDAASKLKDDDKLVGGASLDLLGATLVLQYTGGLLSHRFYYLLGFLPVWGALKLYTLFYGGKSSKQNSSGTTANEEENEESSQRRQKRAEKRRQKWS